MRLLRTLRTSDAATAALMAGGAGARTGDAPTLVLDFLTQTFSSMNPNPETTLDLSFVDQVYSAA